MTNTAIINGGAAILTVGALSAEPGTKVRGSVRAELGTLTVDIPLALVNGSRPGPRVVITAGVHGGEFTGIDAAHRLAARLDPDQVRGQVLLCLVANPPAVYDGRLGTSPLDGVNINRVFPGDPEGSPTERLAAWLFANLIHGADAYVDLHAGRIDEFLRNFVGYRLTGDPELDAKAATMARVIGYDDVILGLNADGGNSHAAAARLGIPAILVETGQLGERDPQAAERLVAALLRVLDFLNGEDVEQPPATEWVWVGGVTAEAAGLWYPEVAAGDDVAEGQVIGRITDPADGGEHEVRATATGRVFYGMHGLTVVPGTELAAIAAPR
ncbi:succinylglutamate desuccinylase/aspartoacylase family protein [Saccharothrix deserti]|uniref:succinylglutamate desuccinylase/aspartoacylase family protein n=1 Tax=Saccharothrix deserti TaxID=2593674 RepID=UPI00131EC63E|nr:succinylglutamate desuccinylase/aspartoacylase family protein [Saccharothrix deserti]